MTFRLNESEQKSYNEFVIEHKHPKNQTTIGGKHTIAFTPTGLGPAIEVTCNICGAKKDITDYDSW